MNHLPPSLSDNVTTIQRGLRFFQSSYPARAGLLLLSWIAVWFISSLVEYTSHASVWFPPAGLTFAVLFLSGWRAIPILMLAAMIATIITNKNYQLQIGDSELFRAGLYFGIAHVLPYYLGSKLLYWITEKKHLTLAQLIISFFLIATISALIATMAVLHSLILTDMMTADAFATTWLPFWIGDMAGIIVLAPLFFSLLIKLFPEKSIGILTIIGVQSSRPSPQYKYKILICIASLLAAMLLAKFTDSSDSSFAIFFLVLPHMWIACTENAFINILSVAISSFLMVFMVHILSLMDVVLMYQFAINVVATNALFAVAIPALTADNDQLKALVFTDTLTQTASRDYLIQQVDLAIWRAQRSNKPVSMLVFDIDHFKQINDVYGHDVGDHALKTLSHVVKQLLRPTDTLGRYGGDEFVILLTDTNAATATRIGHRLLEKISQIEVINKQPLSVSIGITEMTIEDSFDSLFKRADIALYRAKRAGRNCICEE